MTEDIRKLALDALYNRGNQKAPIEGSCFMFNEAGSKLIGCNLSAAAVLEDIIREVIVPAMDEYRQRYGVPDWNAMIQEGRPFAGQTELIGAYWVICARGNPTRAIEFLGTMPRPVLNEAISDLAVYFHPANKLSDVPIPGEYIDYLYQLHESDVSELKDVAFYVLKRLGFKKPRVETAGQATLPK